MKDLLALKTGHKYTIVKFGEMGFVFSVQILLLDLKITPFAQHEETVVLVFKQKGKRNLRQIRICGYDDYLIYDGWVSAHTEMYVETLPDGCRRSLLSFDREYLHIAKRSVAVPPLFEKISTFPNADSAKILGRKI